MDSGTSERVPSENSATADGRIYTSAGHKSFGHGIVFHEQYLLLCAYRSLALGNKFSIACEFEEAGKFDDLVYFHEVNGVTVCEMIQYKHVESMNKPGSTKKAGSTKALSLSQLLSTSKDRKPYSLVEYFNSYLALYYSKKSDFVPFEQKYDCEINSCVLLTNRVLGDNFVRANLDECTTETRLFCSGKSYRIRADGRDRAVIRDVLEEYGMERFGLDSDVVRSRFDDFLKKFVLSVGNEGTIDLVEAAIKKEIGACLRKRTASDEKTVDDPNRIDVLYRCLSNRIFHFHSNSKVLVVTYEDLERWLCDDNKKIGENAVSVYHDYNTNRLAVFGTNLFTESSVKKLKDFVQDRQEDVFCVVGRGRTVFALLKLVQVLKLIGKSFRAILEDQFLLLSDEQTTVNEYLIVRCESQDKWNDVVEKATRILGWDTGMKITLVTDFEVNRADLCRIGDETRWSDLVEDARLRLDSKSISFQGRNVPFSVLDVSGVEAQIDEHVLDDVFRDNLKISKRFGDEKSEEMTYFVDRRIGRRNQIDLETFKNTKHVFVVENMTAPEYESFITEKRFDRTLFRLDRESEFNVLCRDHPDKNISLLYHAEKMFYWKKSYGESIEHLIRKEFDPVIDLNDVTCVTDQTVLIVAEPGMGKSNLLSALLLRSVDERPDVWIVKIDLSGHTTRFRRMQKKSERFCKKNAIEFVVKSQSFETSFESRLFRSYFDVEGKLIVLLDGFDETAPHYRETVLELIKCLSSISKIRVWLTSRPQEKDYLETDLGLLSYSMLEFTVEDRKKFFQRFWIRSGDVVDDRAHEFIDQLLRIADESFRNTERLLTGIPLQCKMLGEVYRSAFEEFYRSENANPELPKALDILDLYEEFKCKIFERYVVEKIKLQPAQPSHQGLIEEEEERLNESHKLLSLEIIFPGRFEAKHATQLKKFKKRIVDGKERTGIVHSLDRDRRPVFLHRTFAEYFSALWFYDELKGSDRETKRDLFDYLEENMFEPQNEVFRKFFDRLSVRSEPVLRHVLNGDLESLEREFSEDPDLKIDSRVDVFRRNVLHLAASYGHNGMISFLISREVRADSRDRLFDWTPLKYGVSGRALIPSSNGFMNGLDYDSIVSLLPGNEDDRTMYERITNRSKLLLDAAKHGRGELVAYLLKHGTDVDVNSSDGCSPLHLAAENGHDGVCATLIEYKTAVDCRSKQGWTPLHHACIKSHASTVALLLDRGADMNAENDGKKTPLQYAHAFGNESIVALMIDRDAVVNTDDCANLTPLHCACLVGHDAKVALLLDGGADVNAVDGENMTPLHWACARRHDAIVALLLDGGADVKAKNDKNRTPLHFACDLGHDAMVALLLDRGADVNAVDGENMTPLHLVCNRGRDATVALLLGGGADVNAVDYKNMTPLHWACNRGHDAVVTLLLDGDADVNAVDDENRTPLHWACVRGHDAVVTLLLDGGADVNAVNDENRTPLHYARDRGHECIAAFLLAHSADDDARNHRN